MKQTNGFLKGSLSTIILKLLDQKDKMYGYEITKLVKELSNHEIELTEGALYPSLHKLEGEGLIESSLENIGNRQRKYYRLTRTGKKEMKFKLAEIAGFMKQMEILLGIQPLSLPVIKNKRP